MHINRKQFLSTLTWGFGGWGLFSSFRNPQSSGRLDQALVNAFVSAGHNDLEKTKSMLAETPTLLNAAHDWGGGDFETAVGGAGHVGNREIAEFLIGKGARVNLFVLTMLGRKELVLPVLDAYPGLAFAKGPHGFTLLHHAKLAEENGEAIVSYLQSKGLTKTKISL